ncbi:MAG: 3D domain-containing protein [Clostridiales bacterium]|jgi:3D (Asp-Asp-Asp) domain-containing protein/prefoldin subunit 5|nr:3D domain-containing protein [Clostridiales bacterium]
MREQNFKKKALRLCIFPLGFIFGFAAGNLHHDIVEMTHNIKTSIVETDTRGSVRDSLVNKAPEDAEHKIAREIREIEAQKEQLTNEIEGLYDETSEQRFQLNAFDTAMRELDNAKDFNAAQLSARLDMNAPNGREKFGDIFRSDMKLSSTGYNLHVNPTASGERVRPGIIAVDKSVIPLHSYVYFPELNMMTVALDTGSAINGYDADFYIKDTTQNLYNNWGRHNLTAQVVDMDKVEEIRNSLQLSNEKIDSLTKQIDSLEAEQTKKYKLLDDNIELRVSTPSFATPKSFKEPPPIVDKVK